MDPELPCDQELADICGIDFLLTDDSGNPYEIGAIVNDANKNKMIIFLFSVNVAIGKDKTFLESYSISDEQFIQVKKWINERNDQIKKDQEKEQRINDLFKAHELDDESIREKRTKLLEEHGINQ